MPNYPFLLEVLLNTDHLDGLVLRHLPQVLETTVQILQSDQ